MKLFASENYVKEQIQQAISEATSNIEEKLNINTQHLDSRIHILKTDLLCEIKKSISEVKSLFETYEQRLNYIENAYNDFLKRLDNIENSHNEFSTKQIQLEIDVDCLNQENKDVSHVFEKIETLDNETSEHFKIVHDTISKLSEIIMHPAKSKEILKDSRHSGSSSSFDRRLHNLDEKHSELASKLDAAIEVIFEKLANKMSDEDLPSQLSSDNCPFKTKQGRCEIWASRKNKADAMTYCSSCIQSSILLDKGIKL